MLGKMLENALENKALRGSMLAPSCPHPILSRLRGREREGAGPAGVADIGILGILACSCFVPIDSSTTEGSQGLKIRAVYSPPPGSPYIPPPATPTDFIEPDKESFRCS